jgi:predicted metalloendopeptidase
VLQQLDPIHGSSDAITLWSAAMRPPFCLLLAFAAACSSSKPPAGPAPAPAPPYAPERPQSPHVEHSGTPMTLAQSGIVPAWLDKSADPCTDFFAFACGGFVATAKIPPDRSSWGSIQIVTKDNEDFLRKVLDDAAANPGADPIADKLGTFYAACMDEPAIEKAGIAPIQPLLDEIAKVKDGNTAAHAVIVLASEGYSPFFELGPEQDYIDATQMIATFDQSGLGLPSRRYYLESKGTMADTRKAYREHMVRMFQLVGDKRAKAAADEAYRIEEQLAKGQQDETLRRDPHALYHRVDRDGLMKTVAPTFPWADYLAALGLPSVTAISVNEPRYYTSVAQLIARERPQALRDYLTWTLLRESASDLSKPWVDEAFTMQKKLHGLKELPPRWRRCVKDADESLGELLGQSYVKARFGGDSKPRAIELAKLVFGAMAVELEKLPWMDAETRRAAREKLDKMMYLVGYPEKWRKYDFEITRTDFAKNMRTANKWERARELGKIGKPVDRFDWQMTPATVNAYYDAHLNEIVLPAGQLQAPFFGATFHPAVNFGSTGGGTIGHEMTHGFDDEGSQFDGSGNMRDWWSKSTKEQFAEATKCVVDQYAQYEAVPGVKLDGKLTAGENIADNGGVKLAYEAYKTWRAQQHDPPPRVVEGFTDDQLYYLAYAQSWCDKMTEEALETLAHSNPHSPPKWRVDGVIVNQPGFGPAFQCAAGTPMNPGKQCSVW